MFFQRHQLIVLDRHRGVSFSCHAREGGHPVITGISVYWIPACAAMTTSWLVRKDGVYSAAICLGAGGGIDEVGGPVCVYRTFASFTAFLL